MFRSYPTRPIALTLLLAVPAGAQQWAFEESFDGLDPAAPSQQVLPATFDFVATHRTHPRDHEPEFPLFPADHGLDCAGPAPPDPAQHMVSTSHRSNGSSPDESFFVCREHMMSSMGDVEGYSVTSFWPRQEFDFSGGGVLAFDVNVNDDHPRSWWEILIAPRDQINVGAAREWLPIDETYPRDRIVFVFSESSTREILVGAGETAPAGWTVEEDDWRSWRYIAPDDPALDDRTIRRKMAIRLTTNEISWAIERADGPPDVYSVEVPGGLPFTRGLVLFKTHAYTPEKDDNFDRYTYHWDRLRFTGPVVGRYAAFESDELGYLQANGNRPIGDSTEMTIDLPAVGQRPVLFGQVHGSMNGQVLLRVNDGPDLVVHPHQYSVDPDDPPDCGASGWSTFSLELDPQSLQPGANTFHWTVGPRPACAEGLWWWDGFSIKGLEVQFDLDSWS